MPLPLLKNTWPLALICPKIWLGLPPVTRFKVTLLALGWLKLTVASRPTLKVFQFKAALAVLWLMFRVLPVCCRVAWPALTVPPVGNALTGGAACAIPAMSREEANVLRRKQPVPARWLLTTEPPVRLPRDLTNSATATHVWLISLHISR